jgi:hypothetical protein
VSPTVFDGKSVELFASAHDVLQAGELSVVDTNGQARPFGVLSNPELADKCGIKSAAVSAIPFPDGNSRVTLDMTLGSSFDLDSDGDPQPLLLVGSQVYGLQETPYLRLPGLPDCAVTGSEGALRCLYSFVAPTTALRNAQTFIVRDIAWDRFGGGGKIQFAPSFTSLSLSSSIPTPEPVTPKPVQQRSKFAATPDPTNFYAVSGYDLTKLNLECPSPADPNTPHVPTNMCLQILIGNNGIRAGDVSFELDGENEATLLVSPAQAGKAKTIRFRLSDSQSPALPRVEWDLPLPKSEEAKPEPSPGFLRVGDSQTVSFSGVDLSTASGIDVKFEKLTLEKSYKPATKTLEVVVTTDVTQKAGRKELTLTVTKQDGTTATQKLPVDVVKQ